MTPIMCEGSSLWKGKKNPVTLVSTVVTRNTAVTPSIRCERSNPNVTANPDTIPIRLISTGTRVKAAKPVDIVYTPPVEIRGWMRECGETIHERGKFAQTRVSVILFESQLFVSTRPA